MVDNIRNTVVIPYIIYHLALDVDLNIVKYNTLMNINDIQIIHVYTDSNITVDKMLFIYFYYVVIISH